MNMHTHTAWPGDAHTLLLDAGSFVAWMVAGLVTIATGQMGSLKSVYRDMADCVRYQSQG